MISFPPQPRKPSVEELKKEGQGFPGEVVFQWSPEGQVGLDMGRVREAGYGAEQGHLRT